MGKYRSGILQVRKDIKVSESHSIEEQRHVSWSMISLMQEVLKIWHFGDKTFWSRRTPRMLKISRFSCSVTRLIKLKKGKSPWSKSRIGYIRTMISHMRRLQLWRARTWSNPLIKLRINFYRMPLRKILRSYPQPDHQVL